MLILRGSISTHMMPRHVITGFHWNSLPQTSSATRLWNLTFFFFPLKEKKLSMICRERGMSGGGSILPPAHER